MKQITLLLLLLFPMMMWAGSANTPVILTAGQSNADGRVSISDLTLLSDKLHFDARGAETLGQRVFDKLMQLFPK